MIHRHYPLLTWKENDIAAENLDTIPRTVIQKRRFRGRIEKSIKTQIANFQNSYNASDGSKNTSSTSKEESRKNNKSETHIGWEGVHIALTRNKNENMEADDLRKLVLLDSNSNTIIFCKREYVMDIWDTNKVMGLNTNYKEYLESKQKCNILHLGKQWFNENSVTNIIAIKDMTDSFQVTMDLDVETTLFVHLPNKIIRFRQLENNLCSMNPSDPNSYITKQERNKRTYK